MIDIITHLIRIHKYKVKKIKRALAAKGIAINKKAIKNRINNLKQIKTNKHE